LWSYQLGMPIGKAHRRVEQSVFVGDGTAGRQ